MKTPEIEHNNHKAIRYKVLLSFVYPGNQDGYMIEESSHADNKEQAVLEVLMNHMQEPAPLSGIAVYELIFTC